ncbi:MAG: GNAT family N-acetyltransferase [Actinomycetota bacterium]
MVDTYIATELTPELREAMDRLVPQLSKSNPPPSDEALQELVDSEASTLFMCRDETGILGTLTLILFRIPTGIRAWIEDVIVDEAARGKGVGRILNEAAIEYAFEQGAITVDLTSRPSREAANRLYQRIGFVQRDTNVYRYAPPEQLQS